MNIPGVGDYSPKIDAIKSKGPKFRISIVPRFKWLGESQTKGLPILYQEKINTLLKRNPVLFYLYKMPKNNR